MSEIKIAHYGEQREVNGTEEELLIYEKILSFLADDGIMYDYLELTRKSDDYITAGVPSKSYGFVDVMRFKYTSRAKWIILPLISSKKIRIEDVDDLEDYQEEIVNHYKDALQYKDK